MSENTVWIAPGATAFSALCERCLEARRGESFLHAIRAAVVRGTIDPGARIAFARCSRDHAVTVRRVDRPPSLPRRNARQLELA